MTKIRHMSVLSERQQMMRDGAAIIATLCAVLAVWLVWHIAQPITDAHGDERIIRSACRLPAVEGAMTVYIRQRGKLDCWEWK